MADWWNDLLNNVHFVDTAIYFVLSLPVGAWLYGLVFGALRRTEPPTTAAQCTATLEKCRILPGMTAIIVVAALCGVYALFFAVQAGEWFAAAPLGLSAPDEMCIRDRDSAFRIAAICLIVPQYGMAGFLGVMVGSNLLTCGLNLQRMLRKIKKPSPDGGRWPQAG